MAEQGERMKQLAEDVRKFHERATAHEANADAISKLLHMAPEAPIRQSAWNLIQGYADALDRAWGIGSWLTWWWNELWLGAKPSEAALAGEDLRPVRTIDDLVQIILDDLQNGEIEK